MGRKEKKKRQLIFQVREYWENLEKKTLKKAADEFKISAATVKRYVHMSDAEIEGMDTPTDYPKRYSPMSDWLNIIYKMMCDGLSNETIYFYILQQAGFQLKKGTLAQYIYYIGKNNFPGRRLFNTKYIADLVYPPDVTVIYRSALLKYVLTCNPKTKKDKEIEKNIDVIKEKYPTVCKVENIFKEFHSVVMGGRSDKLDEFLEKYGDGELESFCNGIKKDILSVKNAITRPESSGPVEGGNNKFKLIKRIVYGRSGLVNLEKKCRLAFMSTCKTFSLGALV